jgi:MSHA biogenesis protein MshG
MQSFTWRGRNGLGELVSGRFDAATENAVAEQLLATGVTPVQIAPAATAAAEPHPAAMRGVWQALRAAPLGGLDLLVFTRQLFTLQRAGVPILRSLAGLQASSDKPALVALVADLRASLDQGRELATAMARHPRVFDAFYVAMIRVGEMTGSLTATLQRLASHIEFELDVRARVKQALRYPALVVVAIAIALVIINLFVIPAFASIFANFKAELPLVTRLLLGFSRWMVAWWPLLLAATVAAVWGVRAWLAAPRGRYLWDRAKLRVPVAGPIVLKATLGRFARSFAIASRAGVPISSALTVVAQTVDNAFIGRRLEQMRDAIERGESLSRAAGASGVFTPIVMQMIVVGEETGELDTLLEEVAAMYERETDYAIKGLSASIEPILLTVIGALVLVLALGVFLPLWDLGQAARASR